MKFPAAFENGSSSKTTDPEHKIKKTTHLKHGITFTQKQQNPKRMLSNNILYPYKNNNREKSPFTL